MQNPWCLYQFIHGPGHENGSAWEISRTNGKYQPLNINTELDIREGKAYPICHPKEGAPRLTEIGIAIKWTACGRHERQGF